MSTNPISLVARISLILAVVAMVPLAQSDEGRTPLYEPTTINMPGSYVLTRDLSSPTGPVLTIMTEGVTVDLNGFEIHGMDPAAPAILFDPPISEADHGDNYLSLHGGSVVGGLYGLHVTGGQKRNVTLHHMLFGGAVNTAVRVDDVGSFQASMVDTVETVVGFDLMCQPPDPCGPATVRDSNIQASRGVQCTGVTCGIRGNSFTALGSAIRLFNSPNSYVEQNQVVICPTCFNPQPEPPAWPLFFQDSPGAFVGSNTIFGDPTPNGMNHGISIQGLSPGARIAGNSVHGVGDNGIQVLSTDAVVSNNLVTGVGGSGVVVDGMNNFVEGNKMSNCGAYGVDFLGGDHVYRGNILLGNDSGAVNLPAAGTVRDAGGNEE